MRVLLFGHPLSHSLSPRFQNAAFRALGLDVCYEICPKPQLDRLEVRRLLLSGDVIGANVTVPHKEAAMKVVDALTDSARLVGAVNTIFREATAQGDRKLIGENTDLGGFVADLSDLGIDGPLQSAVIIGAGGAARAILAALADRTRRLALVNRTPERAQRLIAQLDSHTDSAVTCSVHTFPAHPDDDTLLVDIIKDSDIVIDATPLGQGLSADDAGFAEGKAQLMRLPLHWAKETALFYDLKYGAESPFLAIARELGVRATDGLGMLVHQGALAFERWTGRPAPIDVMRDAVK